MLKVKNLNKYFNTFNLENINLELEPGYIMGIIGPNGSGKTTLIKSIMGLIEADSGNIELFGKNININPIDIKNDIGFVYDTLDFYDHLSVKEFKKLMAIFYKNFDQTQFDSLLKKFNININMPIKALSKGQSTKLMLANALSHNAKLLILDEPTAGLDPIVRKELLGYLQEFIENGKTSVIISTHNTEELDKIADYITFINKGKMVFSLDKETLLETHKTIIGTKEEIESMNNNVVGKRHLKYYSEALVRVDSNFKYYDELKTPNIEEIMYYYIKGEEIND